MPNKHSPSETTIPNPDAPKKWSGKKIALVTGGVVLATLATIVTGGLIWSAAAPASFIAAASAIGLGAAGTTVATTAGAWIAGAATTAWSAATGAMSAIGITGIGAQVAAGFGLATLAAGAGAILTGIGAGIKKAFCGLRKVFSSPAANAEREHRKGLEHTVEAQKHFYKSVEYARDGNSPQNDIEHLKKDYSLVKQNNDNHYARHVDASRQATGAVQR